MRTRRRFGQYLRSTLTWLWFFITIVLGNVIGMTLVWCALHYHLGVAGIAIIRG